MKNTQIQNSLRFYRIQKGLTQWQVAAHLGFKSIDRICKWEKGRGFPHILNALKLQELYDASIKDFYFLEVQKKSINE